MTTLLLLPGLDGTARLFDRFVAALPEGWTADRVAYPGDRVLDPAALVEVVLAQRPTTPYIVVAESFSGPLALALAARDPTRLQGLVLAASFVTPPLHPVVAALIRFGVGVGSRLPGRRSFVARLLAGGDRAVATEVMAVVRSVHPVVLAARLRVLAEVDARADLAACPVPRLWLAAGADRLVSATQTAAVRAQRPDTIVRTLPAPHLLLQTRPELAVAEIREFVDRVAAAPASS